MIGLNQSLYELNVIPVFSQEPDSGSEPAGSVLFGIHHFSSCREVVALKIEKHQQNMFRVNSAVGFNLNSILADIERNAHVTFDDVTFSIHAAISKTFYDSDPLTGSARCFQHTFNFLPVFKNYLNFIQARDDAQYGNRSIFCKYFAREGIREVLNCKCCDHNTFNTKVLWDVAL
jgi:hypothetical protein